MTDNAGQVRSSYDYEVFGEIELEIGGCLSRYLFKSREYDKENKLYSYRYRYYEPRLAMFLSRDPIGLKEPPQPYTAFDSANEADPFGLWKWKKGKRQGSARAIMIAEPGDTTVTASMFARLEQAQTGLWLKDAKGSSVLPGDSIQCGAEYTVPNTVVVGVGYGAIATTFLARWQNQLTKALKAHGFSVNSFRYDVTPRPGPIEQAFSDPDLWGYAFFGHGWMGREHWWCLGRRRGRSLRISTAVLCGTSS